MSISQTSLDLLTDILVVLKSTNSFWAKCGGAQNRTGQTPEEILVTLQEVDPEWTLSLVRSILKLGLQLGTLRQQMVGPDCLTGGSASPQYFINFNMLFENPTNKQFKDVISGLPEPSLQRNSPFIIY
jgi:hypothetical protein